MCIRDRGKMESFLQYVLEFCFVLVAVRLNHLYCLLVNVYQSQFMITNKCEEVS